MRYLLTLVACLAFCAIVATAYVAFPRKERQTLFVQLPQHPSLAQVRAALGHIETIDSAVTLVDGTPFRCYQTDSTFSPTKKGATWGMQWCWRTTRADFAARREAPSSG